MTSFVVLGDIFIEDQQIKTHGRLSPLGGAGNLALNLAAAAGTNAKVTLIDPYWGDVPPGIESLDIQKIAYIGRPTHPRRVRKPDEVIRQDSVNWTGINFDKSSVQRIVDQADCILIEWHYPGNQSAASIFIPLLAEFSGSVYIDARYPSSIVLPPKANPIYWKMNDKEYSATGTQDKLAGEVSHRHCTSDKIREIRILHTWGKDGSSLYTDQGNATRVSLPSRHPHVDPIGCGDTYGAYFIASIFRGYTEGQAMHIASYASGLACSIPGVVTIYPEDCILDSYLNSFQQSNGYISQ